MNNQPTNDTLGSDSHLDLVARTAARWWRNVMANRAPLDNGASDPANLIARALAGTLQGSVLAQTTEEQFDTFEGLLAQEVLRQLQTRGEDCGVELAVDYSPCPVLYDAATEAGLKRSTGLFPWKTRMRVTRSGVRVACGYGAELRDVPLMG